MTQYGFSNFDLIVFAIFVFSGLTAFFQGFVKEILSILGWFIAVFLTSRTLVFFKPFFRGLIEIEMLADFVAASVVFISITVLCAFLTQYSSNYIKKSCLSRLDKAYGFMFGLIRAGVLIMTAYVFVSFFLPKENMPEFVTEAHSFVYIEKAGDVILALAPPEVIAIKEKLSIQREQQMAYEEEGTVEAFEEETITEDNINQNKFIPFAVKMSEGWRDESHKLEITDDVVEEKLIEKDIFPKESVEEQILNEADSKIKQEIAPKTKIKKKKPQSALDNAKNSLFSLALETLKNVQNKQFRKVFRIRQFGSCY